MNKIAFNKPMLLNKRYFVYLDSENKFSFLSKREANHFIAEIGRQIEEAVLFITEEFNSLEEFYRLFFLADKDYEFKYHLSNTVDFINNRLTWITSHHGSQNHDTILFHSILNCIEELISAFTIMQKKAASRNDAITRRRCCLKVHLTEMYKENLLKIGIKPKELHLQIRKARK